MLALLPVLTRPLSLRFFAPSETAMKEAKELADVLLREEVSGILYTDTFLYLMMF